MSYASHTDDGLTFEQFILMFRDYYEEQILEWMKLMINDEN